MCTCNEGYQTHHDDPTSCVGMTESDHYSYICFAICYCGKII